MTTPTMAAGVGQRGADHDEIAGHVGGEQAKQGEKAQRVDIAGQEAERQTLRAVMCWFAHATLQVGWWINGNRSFTGHRCPTS
jgi:hypothetical protein